MFINFKFLSEQEQCTMQLTLHVQGNAAKVGPHTYALGHMRQFFSFLGLMIDYNLS